LTTGDKCLFANNRTIFRWGFRESIPGTDTTG